MKKDDAIAYFKTKTRLAQALGISLPAISQWGVVVPKGRAYEIQVLSNGVLAVDTSLYSVREGKGHVVNHMTVERKRAR